MEALTESHIWQHVSGVHHFDAKMLGSIFPIALQLNQGTFSCSNGTIGFPEVSVVQDEANLILFCTCEGVAGKLCEHQEQVLTAVIRRDELGIFFKPSLRAQSIRKFAVAYGLEHESEPDRFFEIAYEQQKAVIRSRFSGLLPITDDNLIALKVECFIPEKGVAIRLEQQDVAVPIFVVLRRHRYYGHLCVELYQAPITKDGKIKNPLSPISPTDFIWKSGDIAHLKFFTGIARFQNAPDHQRSEADVAALRAIIANPLDYPFYYHDSEISENITAATLIPVKAIALPGHFLLQVKEKAPFYEIEGSVIIDTVTYALKDIKLRFRYFIEAEGILYLVDQLSVLGAIDLLKKKQDKMIVHSSRYAAFREGLLVPLEDKMRIAYEYRAAATTLQLEQGGFYKEPEKIIYLSDSGTHVMVIPVMRYGAVESPVRSRRQIVAMDADGKEFTVERDEVAETAFTAMVIRQHQHWEEQLDNDLYYFSLHKKYFLEEEWFLKTFEEWQLQNIMVLGFNEIENNKLNPHKVKISIKIISGINWFNATIQVRFGKKKVALKQLHKAIQNRSKYVQLDDGTLGILPEEWIKKFTDYFNSGEIEDEETLLIPKVNFSAIEQFYEEAMLDDMVKEELHQYREKLSDFSVLKEVEVPAELQGNLRSYQQQGLNWLNFLDDFNFGGCLADDMGLGKSVQIIAFILLQRKKQIRNTNLIVVPATLIFNWQQELEKFAPSVTIRTIYGTDRVRNSRDFDAYEVILTSYGTLIADIALLKAYTFNYIFLDEAQNIKNPETQRYKAVRLLKSRNKIAISGTPVENNTFDLYSQLSFACPGLLGSKQYFRDIYAVPIDRFKSSRRAAELQQKIKPFMLRRTKQEVAPELPDKTEMVLYCEMKEEQRKIYDAYEKEFRDYISATTGEELKKNPMNVLKGLTRLRQICDAPALLGSEGLLSDESAKMDILMEQIGDKMSRHKILVFSQFVSMLDLIKKELTARAIGFVALTGSTRNREAVVREFQDNPETRIFLISLKAGGTGLNLTEADYVYLIEPWWNPAVENQAIDRAHRIGQDKKVVAVRLICPGTIEEKMMRMQETKRDLSHDLIATGPNFLQTLSKTDLLRLLA